MQQMAAIFTRRSKSFVGRSCRAPFGTIKKFEVSLQTTGIAFNMYVHGINKRSKQRMGGLGDRVNGNLVVLLMRPAAEGGKKNVLMV